MNFSCAEIGFTKEIRTTVFLRSKSLGWPR